MERKSLHQLISSAQQELNRLTTAEKTLTRKEKTHRKIVLGGEVVKFMGLDIDHDILVGFLMSFANATKEDLERYISNGARARQNESFRKVQKNKNSAKKPDTEKQVKQQGKGDDTEQYRTAQKMSDTNPLTLQYNNFSKMMELSLMKKKDHNA